MTNSMEEDPNRLKQEIEQLRAENETLKAEVAKLRNAIPRYQTGDVSDDYEEFIEAEGVLWKRAPDGLLEKLVYCPACRLIMLPVPSGNPVSFVCTRCHFQAPFHVSDLDTIARRVSSDAGN